MEALIQEEDKERLIFLAYSTPEQAKLLMPNDSVLLKSKLNTSPCLKCYKNVFGAGVRITNYILVLLLHSKERVSFTDTKGKQNRISERIIFYLV